MKISFNIPYISGNECICVKHAINKLDSTISALQTNNVISSLEAKKLRYYAGIRNKALHADWDEFALDDVKDLIQGISKLIENYLK